jgi:hypothetical protein
MKFKIFIAFVITTGFMLNGCTAMYTVKKIRRTPENLQAYRECQRTLAVAHGYDQDGYKKLFLNCLKTIESTTENVTLTTNTPYPIADCEEIARIDTEIFYFCK